MKNITTDAPCEIFDRELVEHIHSEEPAPASIPSANVNRHMLRSKQADEQALEIRKSKTQQAEKLLLLI